MSSEPTTGPAQTRRGGTVPNAQDMREKDVCFINKIPADVLSDLFRMAVWDGVDHSTIERDLWADLRRYLAVKRAGQKESPSGAAAEMTAQSKERGAEENAKVQEDSSWVDVDDAGSDSAYDEADEWLRPFEDTPVLQTVLPRVCHLWRDVAFSTPSLWTMIVVSPQAGLTYERVSKLLKLSRKLPIDVNIDFKHHRGRDWSGEPSNDEATGLFKLFIPHVHRWRTMKVTASEVMPIHAILRYLSDPSFPATPHLRTLVLDAQAIDEETQDKLAEATRLFALFHNPPSLTHLGLHSVGADWSQPWIASASHLTKLRLSWQGPPARPTWLQFFTILRGTPALQILDLKFGGPPENPFALVETLEVFQPPVELARLTEFRLGCYNPEHGLMLFPTLALPALTHLALYARPLSSDFTTLLLRLANPAFYAHMGQPGSVLSRLDTLYLSCVGCEFDVVPTVYEALQNLTTLRLEMITLQKRFLNILGTRRGPPGSDKEVWLPRLTALHAFGFPGRMLRRVLSEREAIVGPGLAGLKVHVKMRPRGPPPPPLSAADEQWLKTHFDCSVEIGPRSP